MSALDELSQSLTTITGSVTPSIVGIGSRLRGSGVVVADGQVLTNAHNVRGDEVTVQAGDKGIRFLLVSGKPLGEPVAWYGPIVMNTQDELRRAVSDLQRGTFIKEGAK